MTKRCLNKEKSITPVISKAIKSRKKTSNGLKKSLGNIRKRKNERADSDKGTFLIKRRIRAPRARVGSEGREGATQEKVPTNLNNGPKKKRLVKTRKTTLINTHLSEAIGHQEPNE